MIVKAEIRGAFNCEAVTLLIEKLTRNMPSWIVNSPTHRIRAIERKVIELNFYRIWNPVVQ
jgi:hypothetical protein